MNIPRNLHLTRFNEQTVKLIAYICQDGWSRLTENKFYFMENFEIIIPLLNSMNIYYNIHQIDRRKETNEIFKYHKIGQRIQFSSKSLSQLIQKNNISTKCKERVIPNFVLKNEKYLKIWLRAMIDCNGYVRIENKGKFSPGVSFKTASIKESEQLNNLYNFSIFKSIQQRGKYIAIRYDCKLYNSSNLWNFLNKINFKLDKDYKDERIKMIKSFNEENINNRDLMLLYKL